MNEKTRKLGRLTINGKEVDSEKFLQETKEKYGIDDALLQYVKESVKNMSTEEAKELAKSTLFTCENNCGVGMIIDLTGSGRCPKCGGRLRGLSLP